MKIRLPLGLSQKTTGAGATSCGISPRARMKPADSNW